MSNTRSTVNVVRYKAKQILSPSATLDFLAPSATCHFYIYKQWTKQAHPQYQLCQCNIVNASEFIMDENRTFHLNIFNT